MVYRDQQDGSPALKDGMSEYRTVHSQILQDVLRRLDKAFEAFFVRVVRKREGRRIKAGFPRFKPASRYNSFTYAQSGFRLLENGHIWLSKIGELRVFRHREPKGRIKTLQVKRDNVGDWFVIVTTQSPDVRAGVQETRIGIDCGLKSLVVLSSGEFIDPPKSLRKSERRIKLLQRRLSRKVKGSNNRAKARLKLAKLHRKVFRQRDDFLHKTSTWLVKKGDVLVFEDLHIKNMLRNHHLAKSIGDASWGKLVRYASYKASSAGGRVELVDPRGTTQMCSGCGTVVKKSLSKRIHLCPKCGLLLDRDLNAARNILNKAGRGTPKLMPVETGPPPSHSTGLASPIVESGSQRRNSLEDVTESLAFGRASIT